MSTSKIPPLEAQLDAATRALSESLSKFEAARAAENFLVAAQAAAAAHRAAAQVDQIASRLLAAIELEDE